MLRRWSLLLMLVAGAVAGYAFGGRSLQAQANDLPLAVGDTVTLWYAKDGGSPASGTSVQCTVVEIRGGYVRCGPRDRLASSGRNERWLTLKYVVEITKREG